MTPKWCNFFKFSGATGPLEGEEPEIAMKTGKNYVISYANSGVTFVGTNVKVTRGRARNTWWLRGRVE